MSTKAKKGTVKLVERSGIYYLDFRANGNRYRPSTNLPINPTNLAVLKKIASQIGLDIAIGTFTGDVSKYLNKSDKQDATAKPASYSPNDVYERWIIEHGHKGNDYESVKRFLIRTRPTWKGLESAIAKQQWSVTTHNRMVKILNRAFIWGKQAFNTQDVHIPTVKGSKQTHSERKPFTDDEISLIIKAFESNQFCSPKSAYKHSDYLPMVKFLFLTGCRLGEVVGLKVKHFDLANSTVEISESLSPVSAYESTRVQKSTKTGSVRVLPLPSGELIEELKVSLNKQPDAYVFTGSQGKPINQNNFSQRIWKPILQGLGIPYRVPYAARHTMASRAIEQGIPLTGIAYLMGHSDTTMVMKQYGHMINRPNLPSINLAA